MKFCEVCRYRMAVYSMPGIRKREVNVCEECMEEVFEKAMAERAEATLQ